MNLNKKVGYLLDNGFSPEFVSNLNENKINVLFEKVSKKETKEQLTASPITNQPTYRVTGSSGKLQTNAPTNITKNTDGSLTVSSSGKVEVMELDELGEKFESKAQQGLFWAKCNKCKSDDCKWCKMAKEFSKSTSKKQYKTMPEKKHPEKTVKYKKKETKESYLDMVNSGLQGGYRKNLDKVSPSINYNKALKEHIENIIEKKLQPTMKKRDLMRLIESEITRKKRLNEDFYFNPEMKESSIYAEPEVITKIKTTSDTEERSKTKKRKPTDVVVVKDCKNDKNEFFIEISEAKGSKFFMIEANGSEYCVQSDRVDVQSPDASVIDKFKSCSECERNLGKGGGKEERVSYGIDRSSSEESKGGYREIGNPFEKMDIHKNIDPNEKMLPQGPHRKHKPMMGDISESFKKELNKINEILNRRNRYNNF
jgi:hypothetical protein